MNDRTWKNGLPLYTSKHSPKFDLDKPVTLISFLSEIHNLLEGVGQQNDVEAAKKLLIKYADQKVTEAWHWLKLWVCPTTIEWLWDEIKELHLGCADDT